MIGLIVLFLITTILFLLVFAAGKLTKYGRKTNKRWLRGYLVFLVLIVVFSWDVPIGLYVFEKHCDQEPIFIHRKYPINDYYYHQKGERIYKGFKVGERYVNREVDAVGDEINEQKIRDNFNVRVDYDSSYSRWGYIKSTQFRFAKMIYFWVR